MTFRPSTGAAIVLLAVAHSALAAGPDGFFGSWRQLIDKSGGTLQPPVSSAVVHIKSAGEGRVSVVMTEQVEGGKVTSDEYVFGLDGTPIKTGNGAESVVRSWRQLGPTVWEWTRKGSTHETTGHYVLSKDGKMLTITGRSERAGGRRVYYQRVFEKQ